MYASERAGTQKEPNFDPLFTSLYLEQSYIVPGTRSKRSHNDPLGEYSIIFIANGHDPNSRIRLKGAKVTPPVVGGLKVAHLEARCSWP